MKREDFENLKEGDVVRFERGGLCVLQEPATVTARTSSTVLLKTILTKRLRIVRMAQCWMIQRVDQG